MKKLVLAVVLCCFFGVSSAFADFLGIGKFWEKVKEETTNVLQPVEKAINRAIKNMQEEEDFKRKKRCMQRCVDGHWNMKVLERVCADKCGWDLKEESL
jgi:hypothetical protein